MKGIIDYIQSMHSKAKLEKYYPWVIPYLPLLYGQAPHALVPDDTGNAVHVDEFMTTDERFMKLNMTQFYADTVPDIYLPFCEYHRESCNRNNEWKFKFTFYGYCLEFNNDTTAEPLKVSVLMFPRVLSKIPLENISWSSNQLEHYVRIQPLRLDFWLDGSI